MVAKEFIDFFSSIVQNNRVSLEDFSDRLNLFTVILFLIFCLLISAKQYILNAITCYIPVKPTGENFNTYLTDYCWVHGTIPLRTIEKMPHAEEWIQYDQTRRISYYQWVPFVLGLQCILFYLPHIAWQALSARRAGGDLFALVKAAADAATTERDVREKQVKRVAEFLTDMIDSQHYTHKPNARRRITQRVVNISNGCCVVSKRFGTCLVYSYMLVKVITIVNAICQLYLIQRFLGFHPEGAAGHASMDLGNEEELLDKPLSYDGYTGLSFGLVILQNILQGKDWPETTVFPRVAFCYVPKLRLVGVDNDYVAQCTLPVNMLNEKIYIFLWFWIIFLLVGTILSLGLWIWRLILTTKREDFIKRFLRIKKITVEGKLQIERRDVKEFIDEYLRYDGVFLMHMMAVNAGEVITSEITVELFKDYSKRVAEAASHNDSISVTSSVPDNKQEKNPLGFV